MGTYIQTHSGNRVDLLAPDPADIDINDIAHSLARICRFGGHVRRFYSVADHCLHVQDLLEGPGTSGWDILLQGLMHDAAEAYIVDVPKPVKRLVPEYKKIELRIEWAIAKRFSLPFEAFGSGDVKAADLKSTATEANQLMVRTSDWEWKRGAGMDYRKLKIRTIEEAEHEFLEQFYFLTCQRKLEKEGA